jgi:hypothetical protein
MAGVEGGVAEFAAGVADGLAEQAFRAAARASNVATLVVRIW